MPEKRVIAVRGYAVKGGNSTGRETDQESGGAKADPGPSQFALIFDTETTADAAQQLRVGSYQLREDGELREAGLFYDPQSLKSRELATLTRYAKARGLEVRELTEFIDEVFFGVAYERNALFVGLNLPFDLSRLAHRHGSARGHSMRGGFTFQLSHDREWPNVQVKHLSARAAFIQFAAQQRQRTPGSWRTRGATVPVNRGHFCDLRSLAAALTGQGHSLRSLAELLDVTRKLEMDDYRGPITAQYLDYAVGDVETTWHCYQALATRYRSFGLAAPVSAIYSEASIGKEYLRAMGVKTWRELQPDFPPQVIGTVMSSYYGGRSEVRVRHEVARCLYLDFLSQYATCCALMGLWRFVIAKGVEHEDSTDWVRDFLESVTLEQMHDRAVWRDLTVLVRVQPDADVFPVRADYGEEQTYTIGLNYLTSETPLWYTLADCIASKLLTGKAPTVLEAMRFRAGPLQDDLRGIDIAGNPAYHIEPTSQDFFQRLIELRSQVKRERRQAEVAGDPGLAARLDAEQQALKTTASATSYGIFIELNVQSSRTLREVTCYGSQGEGFPSLVRSHEEPGRFFHPLLATLITGASHLLLALAEATAAQEGLGWVFCDTDSMCLACPEGMTGEEFIDRARRGQAWFQDLSPYISDDALLELEKENYRVRGGSTTNDLEPLMAFAVSAKRYCLFNVDGRGRPIIRRASAHGLGYLRPPYDDEHAPRRLPKPRVSLKDLGVERWQHDLWYRIAAAALAGACSYVDYALPAFDAPAVSRYAATNPALLGWYRRYNDDRPYREQVRPFGFLVAYQPDPLLVADKELPRAVSPFDPDPGVAAQGCFDRETGKPIDPAFLRTYTRALYGYHLHQEAKFGNAGVGDRGLTTRRHILALGPEHIGKEAHDWEQQFALGSDPAMQTHYGMSASALGQWRLAVLEACRCYGARELARETGLAPSTVSTVLKGKGRTSWDSVGRLAAALPRLAALHSAEDERAAATLAKVREMCEGQNVSLVARSAGVDAANLRAVLAGRRGLSDEMVRRLGIKNAPFPERQL